MSDASTGRPDAERKALRDRYLADGFVRIRSVLTPDEVHAFRAAAAELLEQESARSAGRDGYRAVILQVHRAAAQHPALAALLRHPVPAGIAATIGAMPRVRVFVDQVIAKEPSGRETIPHQDAPFLSFDDTRSVNCWIALDRVTADNGALYYFVGSHRHGDLGLVHLDGAEDIRDRDGRLRECPVRPVEMEPGDAVFHNCLCVHGAYPNTTAKPRIGFSIQYMPDGVAYNGWRQVFLDPYEPVVGEPLTQDCFPLVGVAGDHAGPGPEATFRGES